MKLRRRFVWRRRGHAEPLTLESSDGRQVTVQTSDGEIVVDCASLADARRSVILPSGRQLAGLVVARPDGQVEVFIGGRRASVELADPLRDLAAAAGQGTGRATEIRAQIPGRVVEVRVAVGSVVAAGETILVLEAMKMQNEIRVDAAARIAALECAPGQTVETGAILVRLEPTPEA